MKEEYEIMKITNKFINEYICPNFIQVYAFNENVPLIIMEYADNNCRFLFKENKYIPTEIYKTFLFQILMSIYFLNTHLNLYHKDVRLPNILYKKINPNTVFHYKINNNDYFVPTFGYLFMLADFGKTDTNKNKTRTDISYLLFQ